MEGMCPSTLWALPRTVFFHLIDDTQIAHEQDPRTIYTQCRALPLLGVLCGPLNLGLGPRNPRFVAWALELGVGTLNPHFVACGPLSWG